MTVNNFCILHLKSCQGLTNICFVIEIRSLASAKEDPNLYNSVCPFDYPVLFVCLEIITQQKHIPVISKYDFDMLQVFSFSH